MAWAGVRNAESQILQHAHSYQWAWQALKCIGTQEDMKFYQKINQTDLVDVKDIAMAKHFGQGSDTLAWFWRIGPSKDSLTGEWMEECKSNLSFAEHFSDTHIYFIELIGLEPKLGLTSGQIRKY